MNFDWIEKMHDCFLKININGVMSKVIDKYFALNKVRTEFRGNCVHQYFLRQKLFVFVGCKFSTTMFADCLKSHCIKDHDWKKIPCNYSFCSYEAYNNYSYKLRVVILIRRRFFNRVRSSVQNLTT